MPVRPWTVFASAALVFLVEPMVGQAGAATAGRQGPSVWNTSLAFFPGRAAGRLRLCATLPPAPSVARRSPRRWHSRRGPAAAAGPWRCRCGSTRAYRASRPNEPSRRSGCLGVLAVLDRRALRRRASATAPLVQARRRCTIDEDDRQEPCVLYAASNLGSLPGAAWPIRPSSSRLDAVAARPDPGLAWPMASSSCWIGALALFVVRRDAGRTDAAPGAEGWGLGPTPCAIASSGCCWRPCPPA